MTAVSNSTPLIALAKINRLDLLKNYFSEIYIPEEVYEVRRNLRGSCRSVDDQSIDEDEG